MEIEKAEVLKASLTHQIKAMTNQRDQLKLNISELNQQLSETTERYQKLETLTISHLVELNSLENKQRQIFRNIGNSKSKVDSLKKQEEVLSDQIKNQNFSLVNLNKANRDLKEGIETQKQDLKKLLADKKLLEYDTEVLNNLKSDLANENSNLLFEIATKRNFLGQNHQK